MIFASRVKYDGIYNHSLYFGSDAFTDLSKGIDDLISRSRLSEDAIVRRFADFWRETWRCSKEVIRQRLAGHDKARAFLVHHDPRADGTIDRFEWNSLYIASPMFIDHVTNCEFFGNDFCGDQHITGDWKAYELSAPNTRCLWVNKDQCYLETLVPNMWLAGYSSPAIALIRAGSLAFSPTR